MSQTVPRLEHFAAHCTGDAAGLDVDCLDVGLDVVFPVGGLTAEVAHPGRVQAVPVHVLGDLKVQN